MDELEARTHSEIETILTVLLELTGLPSQWSGHVELVPNAEFKGQKRAMCDIQIEAALADQDERWPTLIHEALHSISAGYNSNDFRDFRGWEEGVVEQLQRLYRPTILRRMGVELEEAIFYPDEQEHQFNSYIAALESLRTFVDNPFSEEFDFYRDLLSLPIKERLGSVVRNGLYLDHPQRVIFIAAYSQASAILTRKVNS